LAGAAVVVPDGVVVWARAAPPPNAIVAAVISIRDVFIRFSPLMGL
jgi:hypothetical protein